MVCQEYLRSVANLRADALSRGRKAQEWSFRDLASHRLFRWWGSPVVDFFASRQACRVPQYFSLDLSDRRASGGDALKERWPRASGMPSNIQISFN